MTAAGRAHRHHRQSQYALAVALAALGSACLVAATQLPTPALAQPIGGHLALSSPTNVAQAPTEGEVDARHSARGEGSLDPPAVSTTTRVASNHDAPRDAARDGVLLDRAALRRGAALDLPGLPDTSRRSDPAMSPAPSSPPASNLTPQPAPQPAGTSPVSLPETVEIPAIGVHSDVVALGLDDEHRLEVPGDPDVAGWYAGGPRPGEAGAAVVVGHVDWTDGPAVFWRLAHLAPGDHVVVHGLDGTATTFVVDRLERWPKAEFPTDLVYHDADGPELRLVTCGGPFDEGRRSYRDNIIVVATLAPPA